MMVGSVNSFREPILLLTVIGPNSQQDVEAVIDTGFNGSLTLPLALIQALGLPFRRRGRAELADGSEIVFDIFEATVLWHGQSRRITVDEADTQPLIGTTLLYGDELVIHVIDGGSVTIQPLKSIP
jgi:clan AA aspartic protease